MDDSREEEIKQLLGVAVGSVAGGLDVVKITVVVVVVSPMGDRIPSPVEEVGPWFGSTPAINSMRSSVVTADRAASP